MWLSTVTKYDTTKLNYNIFFLIFALVCFLGSQKTIIVYQS